MTPIPRARRRGLSFFLVIVLLVLTSLLTYIAAVGPDQFASRFLPDKVSAELAGLIERLTGPTVATDTQPVTDPVFARTVPDDANLIVLIRSALIALNQANLTDNYSVFWSLGAPGFQQANSADRLAELFANLRNQKINLAPLLALQPRLIRQATIEEHGLLRLTGFVPSRPQQINFDLLFQPIGKEWRLFGISVNLSPATASGSPQKP